MRRVCVSVIRTNAIMVVTVNHVRDLGEVHGLAAPDNPGRIHPLIQVEERQEAAGGLGAHTPGDGPADV